MWLSNAAIRRPVAMGCLIIALALLGLNSWRKMGLEEMPRMDAPFITVVTVYPGASPEEIETDVAKRIEDAVGTIDGLKHISSACMENVNQILLEFELGMNVDIAATDVREQIDLIRADLPADAEDPRILKFDVNAKPIITMALTGDRTVADLYDYADNDLKDQLTRIMGVADVQIQGGSAREVHVLADRRKMEARGLTTLAVYQAIQDGVRTLPSGRVQDAGTEYSVKFDADFPAAADIGQLQIAGQDGRRIRIADVARVEMAAAELRERATVDGRPCVAIRLVKKADANAVAVTKRVRGAMDDLRAVLPGGMELVWIADDGRYIESTVASAWSNVIAGILLTAAILFAFLYNFRTLLVVSITMPLTIIIGLFFMEKAGFTLNTSTLIAIGMSVGILVTNSIVVLEGITERLNMTDQPSEAAAIGAKARFVAVLASAGTNVVVLFPLAMMASKVGMFIKPLALTMVIMTVVSLFISFTLTPMLCSLLLRPRREDRRRVLVRMEAAWNRGFARLLAGYQRLLIVAERHRIVSVMILLAMLGIFIHAVRLGGDIGSTLISEPDRGEIFIKLEYPTRYDLDHTWQRLQEVERRIADLPELRHRLAVAGRVEGVIGRTSEGVYLAQMLLKFTDRDQRSIPIAEIMEMIRSRLEDYPEAIFSVSRPGVFGGQSTEIELEISGKSLDVLDILAADFGEMVADMPGFLDVDTTVRTGKPELRIRPNRPVLADHGMPPVALGMTLRANLEGLTAGTFKQEARNYDIVVRYEKQDGKGQVSRFQLPGEPGMPVLLGSIAHIEERLSPILITRKNKQRISKVFANLEAGKPLGTAVGEIISAIGASQTLPPGYDFAFTGKYEVMTEGQQQMAEAMLIAIVLVFLCLGAILESFRQPVMIFISLPLALIGVMWSLYITGLSMDIFVIMGIIMMAGIVVNNAILILDKFNVNAAAGISRHEAMIMASCERFRPIIMTTIAAVLGMLPLAVSRGIGAELRNAIGVASVGGILISGILTLILLPVIYSLFTRRQGGGAISSGNSTKRRDP